jgi:hypothetical protein
MAEKFSRLGLEPRFDVPFAGAAPLTLTQLREVVVARRGDVTDLESSCASLQHDLDTGCAAVSFARSVVESTAIAAEAARRVRPLDDVLAAPAAGAGAKRRRPIAVVEAGQEIAEERAHLDAVIAQRTAIKNVEAVRKNLSAAKARLQQTSQLVAKLDAVIAEIAETEVFVETTVEDDFDQGVWTAECFRHQRLRVVTYSSRVPRTIQCNKSAPTLKGFSPGLVAMTCPHGFIYVLKLLRRGESPEAVFDFLRDRCRQGYLPRTICYDNGCNLDSYIAARSPEIAVKLLVLIDRLHSRNHVHCSSVYQLDRYTHYDKSRDFNTQIQEQLNRLFQRAAPSVRFMVPRNAIRSLYNIARASASFRLRSAAVARRVDFRDSDAKAPDNEDGSERSDGASVLGDGDD